VTTGDQKLHLAYIFYIHNDIIAETFSRSKAWSNLQSTDFNLQLGKIDRTLIIDYHNIDHRLLFLIELYSMRRNIIKTKSFDFALRVIETYKELLSKRKEYIMSKQLLRCGTSIGANVEESIGGQSIKDFYSKLFIAYKEARETRYWIKLLYKSDYLTKNKYLSLLTDIEEICKILGKITSSSKK
jgi:four helix bundle protein